MRRSKSSRPGWRSHSGELNNFAPEKCGENKKLYRRRRQFSLKFFKDFACSKTSLFSEWLTWNTSFLWSKGQGKYEHTCLILPPLSGGGSVGAVVFALHVGASTELRPLNTKVLEFFSQTGIPMLLKTKEANKFMELSSAFNSHL